MFAIKRQQFNPALFVFWLLCRLTHCDLLYLDAARVHQRGESARRAFRREELYFQRKRENAFASVRFNLCSANFATECYREARRKASISQIK